MIQFEAVTKVFRSGRGNIKALSELSFSIEASQFIAVIGKSGSGKSTLLSCMGGLEPPDRGTITCFGTNIYSISARKLSEFQRQHMGFVFQRGNLLSYLTVAENLGFPLSLNRVTQKNRSKRIDELLHRIGLASAGKALPHELSSGEIQRVAMARAIAHNPKMLLADEPTANLDSVTGQSIVQLMRDMGSDHGCTVVMATHDVELTGNADSVICLKDGRLHGENNEYL